MAELATCFVSRLVRAYEPRARCCAVGAASHPGGRLRHDGVDTGYLYRRGPEGTIFPTAGHRPAHRASSEAAQDVSLTDDEARCSAIARIVLTRADPDIDHIGSFIGGQAGGTAGNTAPCSSSGSKPPGTSASPVRDAGDRPAAAAAREARGRRSFPSAAQDIRVGGRFRAAQYQYTLAGRRTVRAQSPGAEDAREFEALPRSPTSPRTSSWTRRALDHHQPRPGCALWYPAAGDRRHAERRFRPAAGGAVFHPAQSVPRDPRGAPRPAAKIRRPSTRSTHSRRLTGSRFRFPRRLRPYERDPTPPLGQHQGQFPAVTLSFNLSAGVALGRGRGRDPATPRPDRHAAPSSALPGHCAGFPGLTLQ